MKSGTVLTRAILGCAVLLLCRHQADAQPQIPTGVIDNGATAATDGSNIRVTGSVGQSMIGVVSEPAVDTRQGFMYQAVISAPVVEPSPASLDFGIVAVGQSANLDLVVKNTGGSSLAVSGISIAGPDADRFSVDMTAFTVAVGDSETVTATFAPTVVGWARATLSIIHNGPDSLETVTLSGIGSIPPPTGLLSTTKIAYTSGPSGNSEIYVMDADGSNPVNLTNDASDSNPSWSPDRARIVFGSNRDGNSEIYVMNADGSNQVNITNNTSLDDHPSWSPDGSRIAFESLRDGNSDIYVMDTDGNNPVSLTNHPASDSNPSWSPDGSRIVFRSFRDGDWEIYVMDADGSNQVNITNHPASAVDIIPSWSPDGSRIAFRSDRDGGNSEIYVMDADGSNQVNITNHPATDSDPSWSPDGSRIAYVSNRDGNIDIYVMNADGSNQVNLTNDAVDDLNPSWSSFAAPEPVILAVDTTFGAPGDTVRVTLMMTRTDFAVAGIQLDILPDDPGHITFVDLEDSSGVYGFSGSHATGNDTTRLLFHSTDLSVFSPGVHTLGTLVYTLDAAAPLGGAIGLTLMNTSIGDSTGAILPDSTVDGQVQIGIRGDITLDGRISIVDIVSLVRIIIGKNPAPATGSTAFNIADMNRDGALDIADVITQINDILAFPKVIATGPTQPVVVNLDAVQTLENGQLAIPMMLESNGLIAGAQVAFTFDPALIEVGTPQLAGSAAGLTFDSHVSDGTLRVIVYGVTPGTGIGAGQGAMLYIPVTVRTGAEGTPSITLSEVIMAGPQAQRVPVMLGEVTVPVVKEGAALPTAFALTGNRPNPFNPSTTISYEVPQQSHITLTVYNLLGQEVVRLVDTVQAPGHYRAFWYGRNARGQAVASGVYLYRMTSSTGYSENKRMTLLK